MKRLNFSKLQKAIANKFKQLAGFFKRRYSVEKTKETEELKAPSGSYSLRRGGYTQYRYVCKMINGAKTIYRDFNKHKLPGAMYIYKKQVFRIELNPHFAGR